MTSDIRIELDRDDRTYRPGQPVTGRVVVTGTKGERAERVVLAAHWRTRGKGNEDGGGDLDMPLTRRSSVAGPGRDVYPFRLPAPDRPFTYRGHHLSVEHYLEARAEVPYGFDLTAEREFEVVPGGLVQAPPDPVDLRRRRPKQLDPGCGVTVGAVVAVLGLASLPWPGLALLALAGVLVVGVLWKPMARRRLGMILSVVEPGVVEPGEEIVVTLRLTPSSRVEVDGASARLEGREVCTSGSGDDRSTYAHPIHEAEVELSGPTVLEAGRTTEFVRRLAVPDLEAWTFRSEDNGVEWKVKVRVAIPRWPDWTEEHPVVVWPSAARLDEGEAPLAVSAPVARGTDPVTPEPGVEAEGPVPGAEREEERVPGSGRRRRDDVSTERAPFHAAAAETTAAAEVADRVTDRGSAEGVVEVDAETTDGVMPGADFAATLRSVLDASLFGGDRRERMVELVGKAVDVVVEVDRTRRTFGMAGDPVYGRGRTVRGRLAGTELEVDVCFAVERSAEIDGLHRGDRVAVRGTLASWDRLSDRPVIHDRSA